MKKLKLVIGSSFAALALVFGLSATAGAQPTETGPGDNINVNEKTIKLGDCSGIITSVVVQTAANVAASDQSNQSNGGGQSNGGDSQTNTSTNTAGSVQEGGVYFAPNCSKTTNVNNTHVTHKHTHVTQAAAHTSQHRSSGSGFGNGVGAGAFTVAASNAPSGGVSAGAGGSESSVVASLVGVVGSLATLGAGAVRLLKFEA